LLKYIQSKKSFVELARNIGSSGPNNFGIAGANIWLNENAILLPVQSYWQPAHYILGDLSEEGKLKLELLALDCETMVTTASDSASCWTGAAKAAANGILYAEFCRYGKGERVSAVVCEHEHQNLVHQNLVTGKKITVSVPGFLLDYSYFEDCIYFLFRGAQFFYFEPQRTPTVTVGQKQSAHRCPLKIVHEKKEKKFYAGTVNFSLAKLNLLTESVTLMMTWPNDSKNCLPSILEEGCSDSDSDVNDDDTGKLKKSSKSSIQRASIMRALTRGCELTVSPRAVRFSRRPNITSGDNCCSDEAAISFFYPTYHSFDCIVQQPFRCPYGEFYDGSDKIFVRAESEEGCSPYSLQCLLEKLPAIANGQKIPTQLLSVKWTEREVERDSAEFFGQAKRQKINN
jgi:hypothetical protein